MTEAEKSRMQGHGWAQAAFIVLVVMLTLANSCS